MPHVSSFMPLIGSAVHIVNALLEWLMTYAIHSTILIGSLLLLTSTAAGRRLVAGHGSALWRFALVGALVTSSLQAVRSSAPVTGTLRLDGDTPARTMVRVEVSREALIPTLRGGRPALPDRRGRSACTGYRRPDARPSPDATDPRPAEEIGRAHV